MTGEKDKLVPRTTDQPKTSALCQVILIRFLAPLVVNAQIHEGEKSVRGTTGGKYRPIIRLHDLEEDLLPYFDGNTLH